MDPSVQRLLFAYEHGSPDDFARASLDFLAEAVGPDLLSRARVERTRAERARAARETSAFGALSGRERDIVEYVRLGFTNAEIARAVGSSPNTVRNQLASVFRKLAVSTRAELAGLVARGP